MLDRIRIPELTLEGDEHITMKSLGEKFKEPGYTATDDSGNEYNRGCQACSDASLNKAGENRR
ncbi:MAG: hypothetical protein V8Q42_09035 [Anaerovoracaceae bacterium]